MSKVISVAFSTNHNRALPPRLQTCNGISSHLFKGGKLFRIDKLQYKSMNEFEVNDWLIMITVKSLVLSLVYGMEISPS